MKRRAKRDCRSLPHRARTALHEVAHAVAAVVFERNLRRVTIVPKDDSDGACVYAPAMRTRRQREDEVIMCLVGVLVEESVMERELEGYSWYLKHGYGDVLEAERIVKQERLVVGSPRLVALGDRLEAFLDEHRASIEVLAGALMEARTLSAVEVRRVLKTNVEVQS